MALLGVHRIPESTFGVRGSTMSVSFETPVIIHRMKIMTLLWPVNSSFWQDISTGSLNYQPVFRMCFRNISLFWKYMHQL